MKRDIRGGIFLLNQWSVEYEELIHFKKEKNTVQLGKQNSLIKIFRFVGIDNLIF